MKISSFFVLSLLFVSLFLKASSLFAFESDCTCNGLPGNAPFVALIPMNQNRWLDAFSINEADPMKKCQEAFKRRKQEGLCHGNLLINSGHQNKECRCDANDTLYCKNQDTEDGSWI